MEMCGIACLSGKGQISSLPTSSLGYPSEALPLAWWFTKFRLFAVELRSLRPHHYTALYARGCYAGDFDGGLVGNTICEIPSVGSYSFRVLADATGPHSAVEDLTFLLQVRQDKAPGILSLLRLHRFDIYPIAVTPQNFGRA